MHASCQRERDSCHQPCRRYERTKMKHMQTRKRRPQNEKVQISKTPYMGEKCRRKGQFVLTYRQTDTASFICGPFLPSLGTCWRWWWKRAKGNYYRKRCLGPPKRDTESSSKTSSRNATRNDFLFTPGPPPWAFGGRRASKRALEASKRGAKGGKIFFC